MDKVLDRYIQYCKEERLMKPLSVTDYLVTIRTVATEANLLELKTRQEVKDAIFRLKEKRNWHPRTTAKVAIILRKFFQWLAAEDIIPHNPFPFHEYKRPPLPQPKFISEDQFNELIVNPLFSHQDKTLLMFLWDTAIRRSECSTVDIEDLEFRSSGGVVHIPRHKSKGDYSIRYVPFTEKTAQMLKIQIELVKGTGCIFVTQDWKRASATYISQTFQKNVF